MADLVPPGADRPLDAEPWPVTAGRRRSAPGRLAALPAVPAAVPSNVTQPPEWRSLTSTGDVAPPGYRQARAPSAFATTRGDHWGIWACIAAVTGLVQVTFVHVPVLSMLAIAFGASGIRADRLDPPVSTPRLSPSGVGAVVGVVGSIVAVAWIVVTGSLGSVIL